MSAHANQILLCLFIFRAKKGQIHTNFSRKKENRNVLLVNRRMTIDLNLVFYRCVQYSRILAVRLLRYSIYSIGPRYFVGFYLDILK